jgi:sodium transport system permease protein
MNWYNVRLIFCREVRDQLRDRRTLFMIAVLPLLLYPLLGMSLFQVAQFVREQPTRVLVLGREALPAAPPLIEGDRFAERLRGQMEKLHLVELHFADSEPAATDGPKISLADQAQLAVERGEYDAVVFVPPDFAQQLAAFRETLRKQATAPRAEQLILDEKSSVPSPEIYYNTAREKSQLAYIRLSQVLDRWKDEIVRENLISSRLPTSAVQPFNLTEHDVADKLQREAALWSKILPFLLLIWALTGAFYPAVDLCAGEKERGTLETLLSSPAERTEIIWGKLLTVMLFSVATAVLNILSMALTGMVVMSQFPDMGSPPPLAPIWLLIALLPVAALFSALCLALAALARSTKEGQYYLMPLVLVTLPLVVLPMAPGVELNLGNALIPVTGVMLLLRTVLEGEYMRALPMVAPVAGVTLACCMFAIRWAVDQFNSESVLFRESERLDMGLWLKHLMRDREDTPTVSGAVFCGVLILMVRFFMSFALPQPHSFQELSMLTVVTALVVIGTPALLMTIMLTRSPAATLLLRRPAWGAVPMAILLAVAMHPLVQLLNKLVQTIYPINHDVAELLGGLLVGSSEHRVQMLLTMALIPAVFEELAFRGFILSGFRRLGHKWQAIALSSFLFGIAHAVFQQSIVAALVGLVIGFLAVQTGSIFPGLIYHFFHNSLALLATEITPQQIVDYPLLAQFAHVGEDGLTFTSATVLSAVLLAGVILYWFHRLPYSKTNEEVLQEARDRQSTQAVAGS